MARCENISYPNFSLTVLRTYQIIIKEDLYIHIINFTESIMGEEQQPVTFDPLADEKAGKVSFFYISLLDRTVSRSALGAVWIRALKLRMRQKVSDPVIKLRIWL